MRFTEQMVGQRGAVLRLVQEKVITQAAAAEQLGCSVRQVRRLLRRWQEAAGQPEALRYQRRHAAPNQWELPVQAAVRQVWEQHPRWSAGAVWEWLEGQGQDPLPGLRTVGRWLGQWRRTAGVAVRPRPARRFEAAGPLEVVQMDTTSGRWLAGGRMAYVIVLLDDYSRAVLAARAVAADSSWHNLAVLEAAVAQWGPMRVLYTDNGSVFRTTRYEGSRFYVYSPEVLTGEAPTQLARAVGELGAVLLTHTPGNAQAKGKIERWNGFFQGRVLADGPYASLEALDAALQRWVAHYNQRHRNRMTRSTPASRLAGYVPQPLPTGALPLEDICALRETRKVAKDHTFSLDGVHYTLPSSPNLVAFTVELRVRTGQSVRVWHGGQLAADLPHGSQPTTEGLTVEHLLHDILSQFPPHQRDVPDQPETTRKTFLKKGGRTARS